MISLKSELSPLLDYWYCMIKINSKVSDYVFMHDQFDSLGADIWWEPAQVGQLFWEDWIPVIAQVMELDQYLDYLSVSF